MTYTQGYNHGKKERERNLPARGDRTWTKDYRDGYSDGYFAASGLGKKW